MQFTVVLSETADGTMPARVFTPPGDCRKGGIIFYMDAFGLRPELDAMCWRYANAGYVVFMPDLYYRLGDLHFEVPGGPDEALDPAMVTANVGTTVEMSIADTGALIAHILDSPGYGVSRLGTVGYCMGARHALGAGAVHRDRITAIACLHGGRLVWPGDNSPHHYIGRVAGAVFFGFAADDETCPDTDQALIENEIRSCGIRGETEHYAAAHGWTFPTRWCYDQGAAEHAFARVLTLFDANVAVDTLPA